MTAAAAITVSALVTALPGLVILWCAGYRGWWLTAAPAATYGVAGVAAIIDSVSPVGWGLHWFLLTTAVLCAGLWWWNKRSPHDDVTWSKATMTDHGAERIPLRFLKSVTLPDLILGLSVIAASCFTTVATLQGIGTFSIIHSDWDAAFHGSMTRAIQDLGTTSTDIIYNNWYPTTQAPYYPNVWHGITSFTSTLTGQPTSIAFNAAVVTIPWVAFLGLAGFVRQYSGSSYLAAAVVTISPWMVPFPFDMLWRGPLLPWGVVLTCLPAVALMLLRLAITASVKDTAILGITMGAMLWTHPANAIVIGGLLALLAVQLLVSTKHKAKLTGLLALSAVIVGLAAIKPILGALSVQQQGSLMDWPARGTTLEAVKMLMYGSFTIEWDPDPLRTPFVLFTAGLLLGAKYLVRWIWLLVGLFAIGCLFVAAAAHEGQWVETWTSLWWNDAPRLSTTFWMLAPIFAGLGVFRIAELLTWPIGRQGPRYIAAFGSILAVAFVVSDFAGYHVKESRMSLPYVSRGVTDAELQAYSELASTLGPDALVLNNPNDGLPWAYTDKGLQVVFHETLGYLAPEGSAKTLVQQRLSEEDNAMLTLLDKVDSRPAVKKALRDRGVTHIVYSEKQPGEKFQPIGIERLDTEYDGPTFTRLPNVGPLVVWKVNLDS